MAKDPQASKTIWAALMRALERGIAELLSDQDYQAWMSVVGARKRSEPELAQLYVEVIFGGRRPWIEEANPTKQMRAAGRRFFQAAMTLAEVWDNDLLSDPRASDGRALLPMSLDEWAGEMWERIEEATAETERWEFPSDEERDRFIDERFPVREIAAGDVPGGFRVPGGTLYVAFLTVVFVHDEA